VVTITKDQVGEVKKMAVDMYKGANYKGAPRAISEISEL
jgi:hypothetical protein